MEHIKEPKGIDFVIASKPLTDKARKEISEFISNYKNNITNNKTKLTIITKKQKLANA